MTKRKLYPAHWEKIAYECKKAAGWRCVSCRLLHGQEVESMYTGRVYRAWLHAAHVDHDKQNPEPRLAALCPSCHARYDWQWRRRLQDVRLEKIKHRLLLRRENAVLRSI